MIKRNSKKSENIVGIGRVRLDKQLKIDLRVEEKIIILADKNRLGMVIHNFLTNAIKHSEYMSMIEIMINSHEFTIFNKRKHIDEEIIDNIWLSFISTDTNGTGLGLAISKSILELHQFEYGVRNKENGVEFFFKY